MRFMDDEDLRRMEEQRRENALALAVDAYSKVDPASYATFGPAGLVVTPRAELIVVAARVFEEYLRGEPAKADQTRRSGGLEELREELKQSRIGGELDAVIDPGEGLLT